MQRFPFPDIKNICVADVTNNCDNSFFEVLTKSQRSEKTCREYQRGDMDDNGSDQMIVIIFV